MTNSVFDCVDFFEKAVPEPTEQNFTTQLGCHFEEVHEHLEEISAVGEAGAILLDNAIEAITRLADYLKATPGSFKITPGRRLQYLDALCDQMVTAIGCGHMAGMDIAGAFNETNRSNLSKFDENGEPIFNENMKVMKGPNYTQSDLTPYV